MSVKPHDPKRGMEAALRWLRERNLYVLDQASFRPRWGVPNTIPKPQQRGMWDRR